MKILLIEPPAVSKFGNQRIFGGNGSNKSDFRKPPLDLMMISGFLRKNGFDNDLLDANAGRRSLDEVSDFLKSSRPDVVFFSTSTCTIYQDLLIAKAAKQIHPGCLTVAVGTHVMAEPYPTFHLAPELDVIITSSEWEEAALNIIKNKEHLDQAQGISFRVPQGGFRQTSPIAPMKNLDDLGFPSHDKLDKSLYEDPTSRGRAKTMVMGQKACINNCSFCCQPAFFGAPQLRQRSTGHLLEELFRVKKLGFSEVMFNDATLTADRPWAVRLFQGMVEKNLSLRWNCSTRAECLDEELLGLMKQAGCHTIALGLESVDPVVRKNIRKNITPESVKAAVEKIRRAGMNSIIFCVIGFPGETRSSIRDTVTFLRSIPATFITLGIAVPVPGTDFYRYVKEKGYLLTEDWSLYDPMKKPVFSYPGLSADQMYHAAQTGLRSFYLRPSYILERLGSIRSPRQLLIYGKNFLGFIERYCIPKK